MNWKMFAVGTAVAFAAACGSGVTESPTGDKPVADPDSALSGKADGLSNHFTTRMGELPMDDVVFGEIGYPDWFHGYTIDLEAGQTIQFTTWADAQGIVRLYGPSNPQSERLRFGQPAVRSFAAPREERSQAEFTFEVEESGTYMLVYGPYYVWDSTYELSTKCLAGCDEPTQDECESNDDCADGWCRWGDWDRSFMECVPFRQEGESCGGFTPPHMQESCGPEQQCVFRPFVADAPGVCRNVVTAAELLGDARPYDGVRVSIDGYVNTGYAICTQMACSIDNACCNSCGASQVLADDATQMEGIELVQDGDTVGCGGNNCDYADNCDLDAEGRQRVVGTVEVGQYGTVRLHIESVTALEYL